jgi:glycosyltransferase involved in cell wall biosynthesis
MKVCAVIPAYNEAATIGNIIQETKKYVDKVFIVDDASADNTAEIARENGAEVIWHTLNRGYGAAQRTGHTVAMLKGFDYILQLDADGQHDPGYIPTLLETAQNGDYDIVLGSRFLNKSYKNFSFTRKIGIKFFTRVVKCLGHADITDVTSGFKVYKVSSLKKISKTSDKHPAVEQMLEMSRRDMKIKEVSIEMPVRNCGKSHLSLRMFVYYPFRMIDNVLRVILFR